MCTVRVSQQHKRQSSQALHLQDEQELAQAAAAVARLVPPGTPADTSQRHGEPGSAASGLTAGLNRLRNALSSADAALYSDGQGASAEQASQQYDRPNEGAAASQEDDAVQSLEKAVEEASIDALTFDVSSDEGAPGAQQLSDRSGPRGERGNKARGHFGSMQRKQQTAQEGN